MPLAHVTKGKVIAVNGSTVVFKPANSTYELHLNVAGGSYTGPVDEPVDAILRATARKIYTVPSGGLFVTPIIGPTRILQGRVRATGPGEIALQCTAYFNIKLPTIPGSVEMACGPIQEGSLVNAVLLPGATFELAPVPAAV